VGAVDSEVAAFSAAVGGFYLSDDVRVALAHHYPEAHAGEQEEQRLRTVLAERIGTTPADVPRR
jgi:hypothetical protein